MQDKDWFLSEIAKGDIDATALIQWLVQRAREGNNAEVDECSGLLLEKLCARQLVDKALEVVSIRSFLNKDNATYPERCIEEVTQSLGGGAVNRALAKSVGIAEGTPIKEVIRRLKTLRTLDEGVLVYDSTWGFGIVQDMDPFYRRVEIDFEKKSGHEMSYEYAAEKLELLSDDHYLAMRHHNQEKLESLMKEAPADLVRLVISSMGPKTIEEIQEIVCPEPVPKKKWKDFWDKSRKVLKEDTFFDIPKRRSEPLSILTEEKGFNDVWFSAIAKERRMETILGLVEEMLVSPQCPEALAEEHKETLAERLAFVLLGAGKRHPDLAVRALIAARESGVSGEAISMDRYLDEFRDKEFLAQTLSSLNAKNVRAMLELLMDRDEGKTAEMLMELLPTLGMTELNEVMDQMINKGYGDLCKEIFHELTAEKQTADVEMLYWLYRNPEKLEEWNLGRHSDLARWMFRVISADLSGDRLRTQNQVRAVFENKAWLQKLIDEMSENESREFMRWIKNSAAWDSMTQGSILGRLIKIKPELQQVLVDSGTAERKNTPVKLVNRVTSHYMYNKRQEMLAHIMTVEMQEVAKEIGVARSYGDLRENFEYKAAKDKQALLMKRQADLEAMLAEVTPTDFKDAPTNRVGQGTCVSLSYEDGRTVTYNILGEWDHDESLNIISSDTRVAQALIGHGEGEEVMIPSATGDLEPCLIEKVEGLSEEIRAWIEG
ncbi:MAG: hypothetical protein EOL87_01355 [Spartobacteria bacterium]|nr:hypothetical protein [Spartobacteria bacterium]